MKITIEATAVCTEIGGHHFRVWRGQTESGIKIQAVLILRVEQRDDLGAVIHELDRLPPDELRSLTIYSPWVPDLPDLGKPAEAR